MSRRYSNKIDGSISVSNDEWIKSTHSLTEPILLTENDPRYEAPIPNFKGTLYAPQKTVLAAMIAIEKQPLMKVVTSNGNEAVIESLAVKLSERFSFGKTVLSLALVCAHPTPPHRSIYGSFSKPQLDSNIWDVRKDINDISFVPEISFTFKKILKLTVVAASSAIISQWEENTKTFTDLKFFTIENVHSLRSFEKLFKNNMLSDYKLVFVKIGKISVADGGKKIKNKSMIRSLIEILGDTLVSRFIVDDFDTLKLSGDDCFLNASRIWLISATYRLTSTRNNSITHGSDIKEYIRSRFPVHISISSAALDNVLNRAFNIQCNSSFVNAHINSTVVNFRRIVVKGGKATSIILREFDVSEEVIEMIHADAIESASRILGLNASTAGDVLRKILGVKVRDLKIATRTLDRVKKVRLLCEEATVTPHSQASTDENNYDNFSYSLKNDENFEPTSITFSNSTASWLDLALDALAKWASSTIDESTRLLSRLRDNIKEEICQCCQLSELSPAYILTNCCQIILCKSCLFQGDKNKLISHCTNCIRPIDINFIIKVGADVDSIHTLESTDICPMMDESFVNPKLEALIKFIQMDAENISDSTIIDSPSEPYIFGLLDGRKKLPWPKNKTKKMLIFSAHVNFLSRELTSRAIKHKKLQGTISQKDNAIDMIKNTTDYNILLVSTPTECSGLHLPFLSHIILYHNILDKNVEAQVVARGQRIGREYNLEVVSFINQAEYDDASL